MSDVSVAVLGYSPDPERAVAAAARLCYSPRDVVALKDSLGEEEVTRLLQGLLSMGHLSALEHASFTFGIEGISRACSHQLVRHRVASYSQQSQRYVRQDEVRAVVPPTVSAHAELAADFSRMLEEIWAAYAKLVEAGVPAEDARYLLPNACETKIVVTMNARELRHFFGIRLCRRAQWEIRRMADRMLRAVVPLAPRLFAGAGPGCLAGTCPEGAYSCGKSAEVRREYADVFSA
jgi:thymidylate synthase (FAD)